MTVRCNTDRINYAYDTNHGRFGKTIGDYPTIYLNYYDQADWRWECILCFACTFRDVNTTDGILNLGESYFNKKIGRDV